MGSIFNEPRVLNCAFIGFGTVGRALHALLEAQREALARDYNITFITTGVATRRIGWHANAGGLNPHAPSGTLCGSVHEFLATSRADVVFEAIALDPAAGQPALEYLRAALEHGAHAISANKGPVVHGFRELSQCAARAKRAYRFESAVMDGAPLFSLVRECLPLVGLRAVSGVFTSTATVVLEAIEGGGTLEDGVANAQRLGIAEANPSYDIDGWDSAVKLCAIGNVLFGGNLALDDVERTGIGELSAYDVRHEAAAGQPYRLVGSVRRDEAGVLEAWVRPMTCAPHGILSVVSGATLVTHFEADMFPGGLTITSRDPDATTTAYGMFADFISVAQ